MFVDVCVCIRFETERDHYNVGEGEELRRLLAVRGIMYDRLKRYVHAQIQTVIYTNK